MSSHARSPLSTWRATLVGLTTAAVVVLPAYLVGALAVQLKRDLGFGVSELGLAVAAFFGASALGSAALGRRAERVGALSVMRVGAGLSAVALLLTAAFVQSLPCLVACLALGGMANAFTQPAVNLFLTRRVASSRTGLVFGVKQSAIPAALFVSGMSLPGLALTIGWRPTFAVAAGLPITIAIALGRVPDARHADDRGGEPLARRTLRPLVLLAIAAALAALSAHALGAFLVAWAVHAGLAESAAGLLFAAGSALCLATRVTVGWLADRRSGEGLLGVGALLALGSAGFAVLALGTPLAIFMGAALAFAAGWGWPGLFNYVVVSRYRAAPAAATGITQTGVYVGAALGPLMFGAVAGLSSYAVAWMVAGGSALMAAALVLLASRREGTARVAGRLLRSDKGL